MKQNRIQILQELFITQMNFLTFFPLSMMVAVMLGEWFVPERPRIWVWMLGGLVFFGLYFVRRFVHQFLLFSLLHIVALGVLALLSAILSPGDHPAHFIVFGAVGIGFVIYSIYLRFRTEHFEDREFKMLFMVAVFAVALLTQQLMGGADWGIYHSMLLIMLLALYFINFYLAQYREFLNVNASSTGVLPEKAIFRSGMKMVLGYTAAGALILVLVPGFEWLQPAIEWLKNALIYILRLVIGLFLRKGEAEEIVEESKVVSDNAGNAGMPDLSGAKTWIGWKILEVIFLIVLAAGLLYVIYRFLRWLVRTIRSIMSARSRCYGETQVGDIGDVREELEITKKADRKKKGPGIFGFLDARERIRKMYKKKAAAYLPRPLQENIKAGRRKFRPELLPFFTAREMEQEMESQFLADIYEKARYSNLDCTPQDVKRMKEVCKN